MKIRYLVLIGLLFCKDVFSQNIVSELKIFYNNANIECYLEKIQDNIMNCHAAQCDAWGVDKSVCPPPEIDLRKERIVSMLDIQFVDMETFDYNDDIYNHITIDSIRVFTIACVDEKMNVFAFANYFDGIYAYTDLKLQKGDKKLKQVIKNINKQQPELILFCHALMGFHDFNGFMYIKKGKIYVYRVNENDIFELNDYIRKFFSLERIRKLSYMFVPFIYRDKESSRRAGDTPLNEIGICP
jgi:hypothetical protein